MVALKYTAQLNRIELKSQRTFSYSSARMVWHKEHTFQNFNSNLHFIQYADNDVYKQSCGKCVFECVSVFMNERDENKAIRANKKY